VNRKGNALVGFGGIVGVWIMASLLLPDRIMPGPLETSIRMITLIGDGMLLHLAASVLRLATAVAGAVVLGVPIGLAMGLHPKLDRFLSPIAYVFYPIPKIALLPVFMILLGIGNAAKIILVITIIIFQLLLAARDGVRELPDDILLAARSLDLPLRMYYRDVVIPAVLPRLFTALRLCVGISFSVIFFSESFATRYGIGYFIMNAWAQVLYIDMYAGILALSITGFLVFKAIDLLQRISCPWLAPPAANYQNFSWR
jgi:NitT/TauT family transport system permease protein